VAEKSTSRDTDIQALLLEAVEVQLAAFRANINFWTEWVEEATRFSEQTMRRLSELQADPAENGRVLLEMTDLSRESLRSMTQLPRRSAEFFIRELDNFEKAKKSRGNDSEKSRNKPRIKPKVKPKQKPKPKTKTKAKRAARVKP